MLLFIVLQFILLVFMLFHDWIPVPPFNNIEALKKSDSDFKRLLGSVINGTAVIIPLILTLTYYHNPIFPRHVMWTILYFYLFLTIGTILSWWTPYFFTSSEKHKQQFTKFKNTHHFLPARGDNIIPNTLHVILHVQVWMCLIIAMYFLL